MITVLMNVYEGEAFLEYSLKSIYDVADQIIIINGAFIDKMPSPYSKDKTERIILSFPQHKIEYLKTYADSQVEQRNKVMSFINNGWFFIVDDDEVYKEDEIVHLPSLLNSPKYDSYLISANVFTNSFDWFYPYSFKRLFRYNPGMQFTAPNELKHNTGEYNPIRPLPKILMYHYAYVKKKAKLRIKELQRNISLKWKGRWMLPRQKVQKFRGTHPDFMLDHPYRKLKWNAGEHQIC